MPKMRATRTLRFPHGFPVRMMSDGETAMLSASQAAEMERLVPGCMEEVGRVESMPKVVTSPAPMTKSTAKAKSKSKAKAKQTNPEE